MRYPLLFSLWITVSSTSPVLWGVYFGSECSSDKFECNWHLSPRDAKRDQQSKNIEDKNRLILMYEDSPMTWQCLYKPDPLANCTRYAIKPSNLDLSGNTYEGSSILLKCESSDHCSWWHKNGIVDTTIDRYKIVDLPGYNCSLRIKDVQETDQGRWFCDSNIRLTVHATPQELKAWPTVTTPPEIAKFPRPRIANGSEGEQGGQSVKDVHNLTVTSVPKLQKEQPADADGNRPQVFVKAVQTAAAILPCRAPKFNESTPRTTKAFSPNYYSRFDNACYWIHGTTAIFSHRQDDTPGYNVMHYGNEFLQCDLLILSVRREHQGHWYCTLPQAERQHIYLTVEYRAGGHQPDVSAVKGSPVLLPCRMKTTNKLCYWLHDTTSVLSNSINTTTGYEILSDPEKGACDLLIRKVQDKDRGDWYCNILGNSPKKLELGVTTLP